jgi:DNA-binding NarL/FixJ family response regulator
MNSSRSSTRPVRVLLLQTNLVASLHLRLAIDMAAVPSRVSTMESRPESVHGLCHSIRAGAARPDVVVVECDPREEESRQVLTSIAEAPELQGATLVVIGGGDRAEESARQASMLGAHAFIAKPERASELARIGREITRVFDAAQSMAG